MTQPWGQRPTRRCHRISPHRLIIWRGAKPLLCKDAPHAGQGGQAVGRRARSARTASTRWTARTRAACHAARISAGSEGASSTARSRRCISRSSSRMLSCRHSIGHRPPLETLVRGSKSVPHFRCYASPPPTKTCARHDLGPASQKQTPALIPREFVDGVQGRGQVRGTIIEVNIYGFEHAAAAAAILTNLDTQLASAGVDPRIPWLGNRRLRFTFHCPSAQKVYTGTWLNYCW